MGIRNTILSCADICGLLKRTKVIKSDIRYEGPVSTNLVEFIKLGLRRHHDATILIDAKTGARWTGREIEISVSRIAETLTKKHQLMEGDVVTLFGENGHHMALILLGILAAGGTCNFLSIKYAGWEIRDTAKELCSRFLICSRENLNRIASFGEQLMNSDINIIFVDDDFPISDKENPDRDYSLDLFSVHADIDGENDLAVIQYSSGSTGPPKPIPRTHKNLCHLAVAVDHEQLIDLKPGVILSGCLPLTHCMGLWALLASINCGSTFVITYRLEYEDEIMEDIQKYKVTLYALSSPLLTLLCGAKEELKQKYDLSSLQHMFTWGFKILNDCLPATLFERYGVKSLRQCFNMTEAGWMFLMPMSKAENNYLSVGHVCPGVEVMIVDRDTQKTLGTNESGEILVRGPQLFPGYLTDERGKFNRSDFTESGWFRTGDRGYRNEDGLVYINGRYNDIMVFGEHKYFATELEVMVAEHPAIEDACVVKWTTTRATFPEGAVRVNILRKKDAVVSHWDMIEFMKERAPAVIISGSVQDFRRDPFPTHPNGKVDRRRLGN